MNKPVKECIIRRGAMVFGPKEDSKDRELMFNGTPKERKKSDHPLANRGINAAKRFTRQMIKANPKVQVRTSE